MDKNLNHISRLPVQTWKWLGVNETSLAAVEVPARSEALQPARLPQGVTLSLEKMPHVTAKDALVVKEAAEYARENCNHYAHLIIEKGVAIEEPIVLHYQMSDTENALVNCLYVTVEEGAQASVAVRYDGINKEPAFHCGYVYVDVARGAKLQYIGAQLLGEADTHVDAVQAEVHEGATFDALLTELGGGKNAVAANVTLHETGACTMLDSIYVGTGNSEKDFNYRIEFDEKETEGHLVAKGVLADSAKKTMKSTIDFVSGARGAKGREEEVVLVLSDKVINRSTPLLLCGEDFVEAEHATSIGKPNKEKLYYLMARGFSEKEAKKLLVEASLMPLLEKITHDGLREELTAVVQEVVKHAG